MRWVRRARRALVARLFIVRRWWPAAIALRMRWVRRARRALVTRLFIVRRWWPAAIALRMRWVRRARRGLDLRVCILLRWWSPLALHRWAWASVALLWGGGSQARSWRAHVARRSQLTPVKLVHQVLHGPAVIAQPGHAGVCGGALFNEGHQTRELRLITLAQVI